MKDLELSHTLKDLLENDFFDRSPVEHKSFKDIPFRGENAIVKILLFLGDLGDNFKEWMISTVERGSNRRAGPLGHEPFVVP